MPRPRRTKDAPPSSHRGGILVLDKPPGVSSHDVVAVVRRALRDIKVGHTGTLDPFATGVMALVVGRATRLAQFLGADDKDYEARVRLGRATDSYDLTGAVTFEAPPGAPRPTLDAIRAVLEGWVGPLMQMPPQYSAKMSAGTRAYERARQGLPVQLEPAAVELTRVEIRHFDGDGLDIAIRCSAGFYVRSLAHDLGVRLGVGAHLEALRRTRTGTFTLDAAVTLDAVPGREEALLERMIPLDRLLPELPAVELTETGADYVAHGRGIGPAQMVRPGDARPEAGRLRLMGPGGALLAVAEAGPAGVLHPVVVLV